MTAISATRCPGAKAMRKSSPLTAELPLDAQRRYAMMPRADTTYDAAMRMRGPV